MCWRCCIWIFKQVMQKVFIYHSLILEYHTITFPLNLLLSIYILTSTIVVKRVIRRWNAEKPAIFIINLMVLFLSFACVEFNAYQTISITRHKGWEHQHKMHVKTVSAMMTSDICKFKIFLSGKRLEKRLTFFLAAPFGIKTNSIIYSNDYDFFFASWK